MELFGGKVTVFNSVTNKVKLCIQDKFYIVLKTEKASVNSRNLFYNGPFLFLWMLCFVFSCLVPDDWITPVETPRDTMKQTVAE